MPVDSQERKLLQGLQGTGAAAQLPQHASAATSTAQPTARLSGAAIEPPAAAAFDDDDMADPLRMCLLRFDTLYTHPVGHKLLNAPGLPAAQVTDPEQSAAL